MVESNGNGSGEYKPEVEYEYLDSDVWIERDSEGAKDVAYTEDVLKELEDDDESEPNSDN
jgi:hypothetical protein